VKVHRPLRNVHQLRDLELANRWLSALTDLNLALAAERDPNSLLPEHCNVR
jgi:hypothetical protein